MNIFRNLTPFSLLIIISTIVFGCNNGPKVIDPTQGTTDAPQGSTGIFTDGGTTTSTTTSAEVRNADIRQVVVLEVLPTDKYVYIRAQEGQDEFWIATGKQEVTVGEKYFFKQGLLKRNFYSKEYDRTFDQVYLVSNIVPASHSGMGGQSNTSSADVAPIIQSKDVPGSIKIKDIVANPDKFSGQSVQISGTCTKINPNIMGRNWLHIKDGSKDDFDMVVTSTQAVPVGHFVTIKGTLSLKKDFGAGYHYDIIIEEGQIVQ